MGFAWILIWGFGVLGFVCCCNSVFVSWEIDGKCNVFWIWMMGFFFMLIYYFSLGWWKWRNMMCSCKFRFWVLYYKSLFDCWENEGISCKIKSLCVNLGSVLFGGAMGEETRIKIFPFLLSSFSFWGIKCCREWCCWKALFIIY